MRAPSSPVAQDEAKHQPEGLRGAEGRKGRNCPSPAAASLSPGSLSALLPGCFPTNHALGSMTSDAGKEGPGRGSQHSLFSLRAAKEFLLCGARVGAFQRGAAPALLCRASCCGICRDRSCPGRVTVPQGTGSSWERELSLARWSQGFKGLCCA